MSLQSLNAHIQALKKGATESTSARDDEREGTKVRLDNTQTLVVEELFALGTNRYREDPVIFGQVLRARYPCEPGFYLSTIAVRQSTAKKVKALLDKELAKEQEKLSQTS